MTLHHLSLEQIDTIIARHAARDISFHSPSFQRHAAVRWKLENARINNLNGETYGSKQTR